MFMRICLSQEIQNGHNPNNTKAGLSVVIPLQSKEKVWKAMKCVPNGSPGDSFVTLESKVCKDQMALKVDR